MLFTSFNIVDHDSSFENSSSHEETLGSRLLHIFTLINDDSLDESVKELKLVMIDFNNLQGFISLGKMTKSGIKTKMDNLMRCLDGIKLSNDLQKKSRKRLFLNIQRILKSLASCTDDGNTTIDI